MMHCSALNELLKPCSAIISEQFFGWSFFLCQPIGKHWGFAQMVYESYYMCKSTSLPQGPINANRENRQEGLKVVRMSAVSRGQTTHNSQELKQAGPTTEHKL